MNGLEQFYPSLFALLNDPETGLLFLGFLGGLIDKGLSIIRSGDSIVKGVGEVVGTGVGLVNPGLGAAITAGTSGGIGGTFTSAIARMKDAPAPGMLAPPGGTPLSANPLGGMVAATTGGVGAALVGPGGGTGVVRNAQAPLVQVGPGGVALNPPGVSLGPGGLAVTSPATAALGPVAQTQLPVPAGQTTIALTPLGRGATDKFGRPFLTNIIPKTIRTAPPGYVVVELPDGTVAAALKQPAISAGLYRRRRKPPISAGDWAKVMSVKKTMRKIGDIQQTAKDACRTSPPTTRRRRKAA